MSGAARYRVEITEGQRRWLLAHGPHVMDTSDHVRVTIDHTGLATVEVHVDETMVDLPGMAREIPSLPVDALPVDEG